MQNRNFLTADGLFMDTGRTGLWGLPEQALDTDLMYRVINGRETEINDLDIAIMLANQVKEDLTAEGTSGGPRLDKGEIALAIRALTKVMQRLGVEFALPFRDYDSFRRYWKANGAHGSWQARRDIINDFMDEPLAKLYGRQDNTPAPINVVGLDSLKSAEAIHDHLQRLNRTIESDPRLAVSVAKDLVESTAKLVLSECGEPYQANTKFPQLAERAQTVLGLHAKSVTASEGTESIKQLLGGLSTLIRGLAELRNQVGVGHGRESVPTWIQPRHARLAAGVATTWCDLVLETLGDPDAPWRGDRPAR